MTWISYVCSSVLPRRARLPSSAPWRPGGLRHRVGHAVMRVGRETEQLGALLAQLQYLGDRRIGVVGVAIVAATDERLVDLFAQLAVGRALQNRLRRRSRVLADRKSVVWGKSGSVRVDLGGGGIITK